MPSDAELSEGIAGTLGYFTHSISMVDSLWEANEEGPTRDLSPAHSENEPVPPLHGDPKAPQKGRAACPERPSRQVVPTSADFGTLWKIWLPTLWQVMELFIPWYIFA